MLKLGHNEICRLLDLAPGTASSYVRDGKPVPTRDGSREYDLAPLRGDDGKYHVPEGHELYETLRQRLQGGDSADDERKQQTPRNHSERSDGGLSGSTVRENPTRELPRSELELEMKKLEYRQARNERLTGALAGLGSAIVEKPHVMTGALKVVELAVPVCAGLGASKHVFDNCNRDGEKRPGAALFTFFAVAGGTDLLIRQEESIVARACRAIHAAMKAPEPQEGSTTELPPAETTAPGHSGDGVGGLMVPNLELVTKNLKKRAANGSEEDAAL